MSRNCSHTRITGRWVQEEDWDTGQMRSVWEERQESAQVDIDLHRYKCSLCGEIGYYSGAARAYYEDGVRSNVAGLDR